jgi:hypothetical protein
MFFLQALLAVKPVAVEEEQEAEVPTHPEDGTPQPGNSKVRRENLKMDCLCRGLGVLKQPPLLERLSGLRLPVR